MEPVASPISSARSAPRLISRVPPCRRDFTTFSPRPHGKAFSFGDPASFDYGSTVEPVGVVFPDLNGDGRPEVCFATSDGYLHAFLGDGRFIDDGLSAVRLTRSYAGPKPEALLAEDLDGDGKGEIIASVEVPGLVILSDWSRR